MVSIRFMRRMVRSGLPTGSALVLAAGLWTAPVSAAVFSTSATPPVSYYLANPLPDGSLTYIRDGASSPNYNNYQWIGNQSVGQSFTTGANPVTLSALTMVTDRDNGGTYGPVAFRLGTVSGGTFTEIYSETANATGLPGNTNHNGSNEVYYTIAFSGSNLPTLQPNTSYAFFFSANGGFLNYVHYEGNDFTPGNEYTSNSGSAAAAPFSVTGNTNNDLVFYLQGSETAPEPASLSVLALGALALLRRRR